MTQPERARCPAVTDYRTEGSRTAFNVRCEHPEGHSGDHLAFFLGMDLRPREVRWINSRPLP